MPSACPDFNVERFLQLCFLLLLARGSSHGYELLEEIRKTWFRHEPLDVGLVYRNLRRMEGGLVGSEWIVGNSGPAKRVCCVTERGHSAFRSWIGHIQSRLGRLEIFLGTYEELLF